MFGLHETSYGSSYVPPALLVHLSQLHKKGTLYLPPRKVIPPAPAKDGGSKPEPRNWMLPRRPASPVPNPLPMKLFFAATALSLVIQTCIGLFMSWKYTRSKAVFFGVFFAGIACPLLLLLSMTGRKLDVLPNPPPHSSLRELRLLEILCEGLRRMTCAPETQ
jgi:hypothetical protein